MSDEGHHHGDFAEGQENEPDKRHTGSFAEGQSLWVGRDYGKMNAACADTSSSACKTFLAANTKARVEWRLEQRLREFEGNWK